MISRYDDAYIFSGWNLFFVLHHAYLLLLLLLLFFLFPSLPSMSAVPAWWRRRLSCLLFGYELSLPPGGDSRCGGWGFVVGSGRATYPAEMDETDMKGGGGWFLLARFRLEFCGCWRFGWVLSAF
jgi:hypothetical protein